MRVVYRTCAGMDVHKRTVTVCLVWWDADSQRHQQVRTFRTMTKDLLALREWLCAQGCRIVAMESTGVYWQPVFNLLEDTFEVLLVNPSHIKQVPGRKTDVKDCEWIAELLEHGLLKGSFIPPREIRDLRDLTRQRRRLIQIRASEVNRLHKVLESANIKLASVTTDVMGVSGQAMLKALLGGERNAQRLAELSRGRLRKKKADLVAALEGRFRPHHAQLLARLLAHIEFLDESIAECDAQVEALCRPYTLDLERLDGIPGVDRRSAQDLLGEIGVDMRPFPSHKHLCSWAHVSPGNNESAGKRKSGRTGKGNRWLRALLIECAHAAGRSRDTYLGEQYRRAARRRGKKHAAMVVAHSQLEAVYFILRDKVTYHELGAQHFDQINQAQVIRYHVRRLESLGLTVQVTAAA
jgi:transposase